jgi:hypothetical protein
MELPGPSRALAYALSLNRVAFGVRFLAQPGAAGPTWIGRRAARRTSTQVFIRGLGARDVGLGAGALAALHGDRDAEASRWMLAHAIADATDLAATAAGRGDLPAKPSRTALIVAGASTAVAVWTAAALARGAGRDEAAAPDR